MTTLLAALVLLASIPAIITPFVYGLTARWKDSLIGRSHMAMTFGLAAIMLLVLLSLFLGDLPGRTAIRIGTWSLLALIFWADLITYIVTLRRVKRQSKEKE